ncbi:DUF917 domain-containing protein [Kamptonema animale CS-326]|jgi:DUF917 family protein|uniref:DUF917 domain-containing protein n=1 Tax=Kamptonema animale TaxID=92934 RepID=UPI00232AC4A6|nr:DUF917 domain-containing protein [Kamptonema animale]MDB9511975.1 DUF917 domain-containing protein [Kamptonema animale CS-326]
MRQLGPEELEDILNGAAFFASGGGGSRTLGETLIQEILKIAGGVTLIDVTEVQPDDWGAVAAGIGAPNATHDPQTGTYRIPKTYELLEQILESPLRAFELLSQTLQRKFSYTLSIEIGTGNIFVAMLVAASKKLPVVDCDGAGRSVPELSMTTYAATGISISPFALASEKEPDIKAVLYAKTPADMEQLVRPIISTPEFGQLGGLATHALDGQTMWNKKAVIPGTISVAQELGHLLRTASDPVNAVLDFFRDTAFFLFRGTLKDVTEQTQGGFDRGIVTLENDGGEEVYVIYQNENLMAWRNDRPQPIAMAPDLISYMTPEGLPLTNADNLKDRIGQELILFGVQAREELRQGSILAAFQQALTTLGYYGPYVPIEYLNRYQKL